MSQSATQSVCIVRLSAIGDVTHVIPVVRAIQVQRPKITITWIIGTLEARLVGDLPGVEFILFQKSDGIKAYFKLKKQLRDRHFDIVLGMQVSMRANLILALLKADRKIGFDRARSKDFHQWFITEHIQALTHLHVLDGLFQFAQSLGIEKTQLDWSVPISKQDLEFARTNLPDKHLLAISPCSSHRLRNWSVDRYAEVANYAAIKYHFHIVLVGGKSALEQQMGEQIAERLNCAYTNLIGKDTLKKLLAVLQHCNALISPDSGPAHMAACVDLPVIGLYAASNPLRSGPYKSLRWCANSYPQASEKFLGKAESSIKWGKKIERDGVMDLISVQQVMKKLDELAYTLDIHPDSTQCKDKN